MKECIFIQDIEGGLKTLENKYTVGKYASTELGNIIEKHNGNRIYPKTKNISRNKSKVYR